MSKFDRNKLYSVIKIDNMESGNVDFKILMTTPQHIDSFSLNMPLGQNSVSTRTVVQPSMDYSDAELLVSNLIEGINDLSNTPEFNMRSRVASEY